MKTIEYISTGVMLMDVLLHAIATWFQPRLEVLNNIHYMDDTGYMYNECTHRHHKNENTFFINN